MIKHALPAAVAALALGLPVAVEAQMPAPPPLMAAPPAAMDQGVGPAVAGPPDFYNQYSAPVALVPVPPGSIWIPGHYNWDPAGGNYVWVAGEYAQPPRPGAQWVDGHWTQTATSWVWVDGGWN